MIGYVKGILEEADDQCIIVDNHGIGYRIFVPGSVFSGAIPIGQEVKVYTYLNVKEDAMQLYGFATRDDLRVFKLLLGVNGIGPKAGLGILSALSADDLRFAVLADDAAAIAKAPGIGKKTAQKLILELKDKLDLEDAFEQKLANQAAADTTETAGDSQAAGSSTGTGSTWLSEHRCTARGEKSRGCGDDGCGNPAESRVEEDAVGYVYGEKIEYGKTYYHNRYDGRRHPHRGQPSSPVSG